MEVFHIVSSGQRKRNPGKLSVSLQMQQMEQRYWV